ncbi:hypothetical protein TNCV_228351 [Trichonephila clavipes]|nr:hypothetical protein TNCV_228351 [Trichonephila clavipes]
MPPGQASVHQTLHFQRSPINHGESPPRNAINERLVHAPLPKPMEYLPVCVRGKLSQKVVKGTENVPRSMSLETLPEFNDDGTFPNSLHEDILYCTMVKSYQFAKYLQQFNKLQTEWSHKVSIL